jgi:hypothetical protein
MAAALLFQGPSKSGCGGVFMLTGEARPYASGEIAHSKLLELQAPNWVVIAHLVRKGYVAGLDHLSTFINVIAAPR